MKVKICIFSLVKSETVGYYLACCRKLRLAKQVFKWRPWEEGPEVPWPWDLGQVS